MKIKEAKNYDDLTYTQKCIVIGKISDIISHKTNQCNLDHIAEITGYSVSIIRWALNVICSAAINRDIEADKAMRKYILNNIFGAPEQKP